MPLVTCPSGLSFNVRGWKLSDRKTLLDKDFVRRGTLPLKMLEAVAGPVESIGPYSHLEVGRAIDFAKVAFVDIASALIDIRIATKPGYDFDTNCGSCGSKLEMHIELPDLPRKPMSDVGKQCLASGQAHRFTAEDGCVIAIRHLLGSDLPNIASSSRLEAHESTAYQQCMHIVELRGVDGKVRTEPVEIRRYYDDSDYRLAKSLSREIDRLGGGVETSFENNCKRCGCEVDIQLPLSMAFYDPSMEPQRHSSSGS